MSDDETPGIAMLVALAIGMIGVAWVLWRLVLLVLLWLFAIASVLVQA